MKKIIPVLVLALASATLQTSAQTTCPDIINSTFKIATDPVNPCLRTASIDFVNPTNGQKRINITVTVANVEVSNVCYDASGQKDVERTLTTPQFTACTMGDIKVVVTPYSGGTCGSTSCTASIFSFGNGSLPVIFTSFTASRNNDRVALKWSTGTEVNNRGFIIERNLNGTWEQVNFVASAAINGNSSNRVDYQYSDINYNKGVSQYRIKQVDYDNNFKYSEIRAIQGSSKDGQTVVFPNPSIDGKVSIVFTEAAARNIAVTDMSGRNIRQYNDFTANSIQLSGLVPGMYTVRATNKETGVQTVEKIMVAAR